MMINEEIEEGELTSEEDEAQLRPDSKLQKSSSYVIESGELTEGNSPKNNNQNPYVEEDEDMIELKMKALKSLLDKEDTSKKDNEKKFKKKSSSKKLKMKKKLKKYADKLSPAESASSRDNYELKDMDIEPLPTYQQFNPVATFDPVPFDPVAYMNNFLNALYVHWAQQQQQQPHQQHQNSYPQMSALSQMPNTSNNYATGNNYMTNKPKKKFKKNLNRNMKFQRNNKNLKLVQQPSQQSIVSPNTTSQPPPPPLPPLPPPPPPPPVEEIPLFSSNGMDLDERFLDTTTTSLDVDYRQLSQIELFKSLEKLELLEEKSELLLIEEAKGGEEEEEEEKAKKDDETDDEKDEAAMLDLRKTLLDTLNKKRSLKKLQEQEEKIDQDITFYKKKLAEHEQVLFESDLNELKNKAKPSPVPLQKNKIAPVIIRIDPNESSEDDDEEDKRKKSNLQENIGLFLKEAKQLANESSLKRKAPEPNESELKIEQEKKDMIKSLRDRINLKSKMLVDLLTRTKELEASQIKKQKIIEFTKLKITMLREQLNAAEKILQFNEQGMQELRNEKRTCELKLTKIQNMRKTQQEMLQRLLSPAAQKSIQKSPPPPPPPPSEVPPPVLPPPPPPPPPQQEMPHPPPVQTPKPKSSLVTTILNKMTLGAAVAESVKTVKQVAKPAATNSHLTRPNLNTSKQTDIKLEQLVFKPQSVLGNSNQNLNENIVLNTKVVLNTHLKEQVKVKSESKKLELENRQKLIEYLDELTRDYPYIHSETFDVWSYESMITSNTGSLSLALSNDIIEHHSDVSIKPSNISIRKVLTSSNFCTLNECDTSLTTAGVESNDIYKIDDVSNYESPLKVFRGYRFSSHFSQFTPFEEAYSKMFCHTIDYRRPFCPFDLHGSCKDSNCIYQHSNIMTMDNYQRTEHFLSYCPQVLELSSDTPTQREAIKKLKLYAKQFMNTNLNKMSIRDYFKHLYDHVIENLQIEPSYSTILSRLPILCLNNNKSIGVFDHLELENDTNEDVKTGLNNQQLIKLNPSHSQFMDTSDQIVFLLDLVYSANYSRILDSKLKKVLINCELDLEHLKSDTGYFENETEKVMSWIYYAKHSYSTHFQIEKLLNIFSHGLEDRRKCETLWLLYLKTYLHKKNSSNDYHEVCLLCMDNMMTYDLIWFIMNTCPTDYIDLIFERYEKYLTSVSEEELASEFEQVSQNDCSDRVSYYLFELIMFNTYVKMVQKAKPVELLYKYLNNVNITSKLEPNDLSLLWLCLIHLEAFQYLPNWLNFSNWNSQFFRSFESKAFWALNSTRTFNQSFFKSLNFAYKNKVLKKDDQIHRQFDIFLIPWKHGLKYSCSIEKIQNLFHEALRGINTRCPANSTTSLKVKQEIRLFSLPLFLNLINLEVSNKRYEIASKIIDRLLKSADAKHLKELWISLIHILKCQNLGDLVEQNIDLSLQMFPNDAQLTYISAQYFESIGQKEKAICMIEQVMSSIYFGKTKNSSYETTLLFHHYLGLEHSHKLDTFLEPKLSQNKLGIAVLYCYYLQLKGADFFTLTYIQHNFEKLIQRFNLLNYRTILWIRYFKFMSTIDPNVEAYSVKVLDLIKKCVHDLNSQNQNFLIPFNYVSKESVLRNSSPTGDCDIENGLSPGCPYYSISNAESPLPIRASTNPLITNNFFYNCVVDYLLKTYSRSPLDKINLSKYLLDLTPVNTDLIKLYISFSYKLNGLHRTLQCFYDHLSMNAIDNEHTWLLCIKLCLDMNDLQQAVMIFHKADAVCDKGNKKKNLIELRQIAAHLFPSVNTNELDVI